MKSETHNLPLHNDQAKCNACERRSPISIYPDLKNNRWQCRYCMTVQDWTPSKEYKRRVQC